MEIEESRAQLFAMQIEILFFMHMIYDVTQVFA